MAKVILRKNEERRIKQGHLWVFSNEVQAIDNGELDRHQVGGLRIDPLRLVGDEARNGEVVEVFDSRGNFVASGFYNGNSLIAVRVISNEQNINIAELLERRILSAYNYRKAVYLNRESFRLVFSESDFLPGLIIDKYNHTFVLQVYSAGIEKNIEHVISTLENKLNAKNIFTKHDEYFRTLEGLPAEDKIYLGEAGEEIISDETLKYKVNFEKGQKTGFFFDQCDNREYFGKFCKDKTVLDCFCNSGGFGLHAIANGASKVTFVDSSSNEIENVKYNTALNGFTTDVEYYCSDVFDYLEKCITEKKKFDVVNIDPPAFTKNKKNLPKAVKAYEKLNRLALEIVNNGGFVFSSSCSHHLKKEDFIEAIQTGAVKAAKSIQLVYTNGASLDHPLLPAMKETEYLKFAAVRVTGKEMTN
ncbi:MAG: Fmu (Sun) domain-containing protein [Ignavibacteria bacterium]|nr:MAG: Fmu (Sun) domain-containing protein [Ignavibacteria bacterium]KAF0154987.1 MAG: Fmu (Sun) domain-containing protein [Ignavibacteria bacterium]